MKHLGVFSSATYAERLFSAANLFDLDSNTQMLWETWEAMVLLHHNRPYLQQEALQRKLIVKADAVLSQMYPRA